MKYRIKPRGIIKWHPFAALSDPASDLEGIDAINNALVMPELSEEQIEEYNRDLARAVAEGAEIFVSWFNDGTFATASGKVYKVDTLEGILYVEKQAIPINKIVDIL